MAPAEKAVLTGNCSSCTTGFILIKVNHGLGCMQVGGPCYKFLRDVIIKFALHFYSEYLILFAINLNLE